MPKNDRFGWILGKKDPKLGDFDQKIGTFERLEMLLKRVTYKPGSTIHCFDDYMYGEIITIKISVPTIDTYTNKQSYIANVIHFSSHYIYKLTPREFINDVLRDVILREVEFHELDEWLKLDGKIVNDPHKF